MGLIQGRRSLFIEHSIYVTKMKVCFSINLIEKDGQLKKCFVLNFFLFPSEKSNSLYKEYSLNYFLEIEIVLQKSFSYPTLSY